MPAVCSLLHDVIISVYFILQIVHHRSFIKPNQYLESIHKLTTILHLGVSTTPSLLHRVTHLSRDPWFPRS